MVTSPDDPFWRGYNAALDDVGRAYKNNEPILAFIERVRDKFRLPSI